MLLFKGIEHRDDFGDEIVFWTDIAGCSVPKELREKARKIDGENFDIDCFGLCVRYDLTIPKMFVVSEINREVYYVDNNGDKHWFEYLLNDTERQNFLQQCVLDFVNNPT